MKKKREKNNNHFHPANSVRCQAPCNMNVIYTATAAKEYFIAKPNGFAQPFHIPTPNVSSDEFSIFP